MNYSRQQGISISSLLVGLALLSFVVLLSFRLVPIYLEHHSIATAIESLPNQPEFQTARENGTLKISILRYLRKAIVVNHITRLTEKDISISTKQQGYLVTAKYDVMVRLFANMDLVIHFNDQVMVPIS